MALDIDRLNRLCDKADNHLRSTGYSRNYSELFGFDKKYTKISKPASDRERRRQLALIEETSQNDDEAFRRIMSLILDGNDPGQPPETKMVSMAEVDAIVTERMKAMLEALKPKAPKMPETVAEVEAVVSKQLGKPVKLRQPEAGRKRKVVDMREHSLDVWKERCAQMGLMGPPASPHDAGKVDGRSLRRLESLWLNYIASANPKEQESAP